MTQTPQQPMPPLPPGAIPPGVVPAPMPQAGAVPATAAAAPAPAVDAKAAAAALKEMRKKKPEERVALMLANPELLAKLKIDPKNKEDVALVRETLTKAITSDKANFDKFLDANEAVMQARLEVGLVKDKSLAEQLAEKPETKLTDSQRKKIEDAEKAERAALNKVTASFDESKKKDDPEARSERELASDMILASAEAVNGPAAEAGRAENIAKIKTTLIGQSRGFLSFGTTPVKLVDKIAEATKKGEAGKADLEKAKQELKDNLAKNKHTRDLSEASRDEIFNALTTNTAAVLAENDKANPIDSTAKNAADMLMAEAKAAPASLLKDSLMGVPGASTAMNVAGKLTGGRTV